MVRAIESVESIPRAARLIPYILARVNETKMVTARLRTGMIVELYPSAKPSMMFGAAPVAQDLANF